MNIVNNIKSFLYDKSYFVNIYETFVHLYNYEKIDVFNDKKIIVLFISFKLVITGDSLKIISMDNYELLIDGKYHEIRVVYE